MERDAAPRRRLDAGGDRVRGKPAQQVPLVYDGIDDTGQACASIPT